VTGLLGMLSSPADLALLLLLALLLFGAKRLPEIARSLGTGMREFKNSIEGVSQPELPKPQVQTTAPVESPLIANVASEKVDR
jgi:sec-independent protein translocase protein TatA